MSMVEERLSLVRYVVDTQSHIRVDFTLCSNCADRPCLLCCPAGCFTCEQGAVRHAYEGCLECGTCRLVCLLGAVTWTNPRGGYGVSYRF